MQSNTNAWVNWFDSQSFSSSTEYFLYLIDESSNYPQTEKWANWINTNPGPGQRLMSMATIAAPTALTNTPSLDLPTSFMGVGITSTWETAASQYAGKSTKRFFMYNGSRPATGSFAIEVTLNANTANELHVSSLEGEIESPAAILNITHDDIAPTAPSSSAITVEQTPPISTCLARPVLTVAGGMGSVEGTSRVRVTNLTTSSAWSTNATANGTFSIDVNACHGEVVSVVAVDAAGNVSSPAEFNVN